MANRVVARYCVPSEIFPITGRILIYVIKFLIFLLLIASTIPVLLFKNVKTDIQNSDFAGCFVWV
jgi:hypothetical protein